MYENLVLHFFLLLMLPTKHYLYAMFHIVMNQVVLLLILSDILSYLMGLQFSLDQIIGVLLYSACLKVNI
jgi:hypothetical protein